MLPVHPLPSLVAWIIYTLVFIVIGMVIMAFYFILKYSATRHWFFTLALGGM
jgi:heme/copper-type cytochrome/quinol oxidase subunit 2